VTVDAVSAVTVFEPELASEPVHPSPGEPPVAVQLVVFGGDCQPRVMGVLTGALEALAVSVVRVPVNVTCVDACAPAQMMVYVYVPAASSVV
jgi:hypothetical protein